MTKTDTGRYDYIVNTQEGSIIGDYRYDEFDNQDFFVSVRSINYQYITNILIDNYGVNDSVLAAGIQDAAFQNIKMLKLTNIFLQDKSKVMIPCTTAMLVRLVKNDLLTYFDVEYMTASEIHNKRIDPLVTATNNCVASGQDGVGILTIVPQRI